MQLKIGFTLIAFALAASPLHAVEPASVIA